MISASPSGAFRAWSKDAIESAYTPDLAAEIDSEEEILAEELQCTIAIARRVIVKLRQQRNDHAGNSRELFARVISKLMESSNTRVSLHGLACAGGLDELNGFRSQAEIAREIGCTRALVSHYTTAWTDYMSGKDAAFTVTKFRKSEKSRETFKEKATDPFTSAKKEAINRIKYQCN
jgi:predicted transcriptional regulator